jgi:hypothetical protein
MLLGGCEGGDAPLVNGGEVGEEHVYTACLAIRLLRSALDMGGRCGVLEEWGCRIYP